MLIVIILMALFRKEGQSSIVILFVGIALVSWLTIARVVRGQIISLKNSEFVEAARSMGAGTDGSFPPSAAQRIGASSSFSRAFPCPVSS
jgi:ABC-type microcin C transport system permease subunit YejE